MSGSDSQMRNKKENGSLLMEANGGSTGIIGHSQIMVLLLTVFVYGQDNCMEPFLQTENARTAETLTSSALSQPGFQSRLTVNWSSPLRTSQHLPCSSPGQHNRAAWRGTEVLLEGSALNGTWKDTKRKTKRTTRDPGCKIQKVKIRILGL